MAQKFPESSRWFVFWLHRSFSVPFSMAISVTGHFFRLMIIMVIFKGQKYWPAIFMWTDHLYLTVQIYLVGHFLQNFWRSNEILLLEGLKISRNWLKLDAQIIEKLALVTGIIWWIGRSIYFQKNHFQIFCQHKISTEKFKCIWSIITWWRTNFNRILNFST